LGLPVDRPIVLSVGALDRSHKRQDYVITEHARLPPPRPHLVLLGHESAESPAIRALARERLPSEDITLKSVPAGEVADYYAAADVFVLASTREAFGRVLVEALAHGLPCIAHDYDVPRWVLGEHGTFADLTVPGGLADAVSEVLSVPDGRAADRHAYVRAHYSWDALRPRYVELIRRVAAGPRAGLSGVRALRRAR
ncbi:MAG: glycosyltransferase, partial [Solirubrobacterales bacterium]|nr:glycosyltransferase [Solirubrobacterales bacterium]